MVFSQIIRRKFPCAMLKRQYRMHDQLYEHLVDCVYKEPISSERMTSEPSAFLQNILDRSILVETPQDMYKLRSFLHFLDVPKGAQKSHEGGTSWNEGEAVVVNGLVRRRTMCLKLGLISSAYRSRAFLRLASREARSVS